MKELKVRITFTEELLGTASSNVDLHRDYIASKAPDKQSREEEIEAVGVEGVIEKATTIFPRNEKGQPISFNYHWKGFFKDACSALMLCPGYLSYKDSKGKQSPLRAYKKIIDKTIFIEPRQIPFKVNGKMGNCQRPLRGSTPQGERIALANSETIPAGSSCTFKIICLNDDFVQYVKEWLKYGELRGTFQWRNSGKGTFATEYLK